jgi:hypothetical protein
VKTNRSYDFADMRARPNSSRRWWAAVILVVFVSAQFVTGPNVHAQEALPEYQVKAAYLFNFLKFVEYPGES